VLRDRFGVDERLTTLAEYPPVQAGKSFDMSNVVEEFINKGRQ
jgi:arylsulfatase